jgi:hypothetical protein
MFSRPPRTGSQRDSQAGGAHQSRRPRTSPMAQRVVARIELVPRVAGMIHQDLPCDRISRSGYTLWMELGGVRVARSRSCACLAHARALLVVVTIQSASPPHPTRRTAQNPRGPNTLMPSLCLSGINLTERELNPASSGPAGYTNVPMQAEDLPTPACDSRAVAHFYAMETHCGQQTSAVQCLTATTTVGGYNALSKLDRSGRGGGAGDADRQRSGIQRHESGCCRPMSPRAPKRRPSSRRTKHCSGNGV